MNNYDYPEGADNNDAPWNEKTKTILVTISITQSTTCEIEVLDQGETVVIDADTLEESVRSQIELPSTGVGNWNIDDLVVIEE